MLLPRTLLALTISCALAAQAANSNASPLSISPSNQWDGIDGSWSSFTVKLGTPAQEVRTFVSWNAYQTWTVIPQGCDPAADYNACAQSRGGIFNQTASRSWQDKGLYSLSVLGNLGYNGNGYYGFDDEQLGDGGPTLSNTTIVGFAVDDLWLGVLGINPKPTYFTNTVASSSYMSQLKDQGRIPSISFGYTAGAPYRVSSTSSAYGSLTLGGYDEKKFIANGLEWDFAADNSRDIVVALQSVNTPSQVQSSPVATELLPNPISIYLDSTVPQIWLPIESCYVFEYEFGLTYDNTTELYLVNGTLHQQLLNKNASITFQLATGLNGGNTVNIELPYSAFDLTAKAPYQGVQNDTYYFPLRRAMNESQYTLGRTFFQEAYIAVDYENQKFNVSQRSWADSSNSHIVAIPAFTQSAAAYPGVGSTTTTSSSLSGGAIAGIVVGAVAILAILVVLFIWLRRRSKAKKQRELENEKLATSSELGSEHGGNTSSSGRGTESIVLPKAELPGSQPLSQQDSDDHALLASGALSTNGTFSATGSSSPSDVRTPRNALSGATFVHGRWNGEPYSPASDTPEEGTQTHSSTQSSHGTGSHSNSNYDTNTGTLMSIVSPITGSGSDTASEADGKQLPRVFEMQGDMPPVREKDGKEMNEKEVLAYREKKYNGVSTPPISPIGPSSAGPARNMVRPEDVVRAGRIEDGGKTAEGTLGLHKQFSFEEMRGKDQITPEDEDDLYKG